MATRSSSRTSRITASELNPRDYGNPFEEDKDSMLRTSFWCQDENAKAMPLIATFVLFAGFTSGTAMGCERLNSLAGMLSRVLRAATTPQNIERMTLGRLWMEKSIAMHPLRNADASELDDIEAAACDA